MTTSISARVTLGVVAEIINSLDVGEVKYPISYGANYVFTDGTGANQAKEVFTDTRTLTASAAENLDLAGVLLDAFGNTLTFAAVKAIIVKADAANVNDVVLGNHATAAFFPMFGAATHTVKVKPGGMVAFVAPDATGLAVTATTADMLTVTNGGAGTSVVYTIIIIGTV
jgi:hypothetical protein